MATLTTGDIKTLDELSEISKEQLANEDSILTYDKDMSCHKKLTVAALKALMLENSNGAEASEAAAEASAEASAESAEAAASSAADAGESAVLARSWAVGGTGAREGEDTDNASYYASQAAASAAAAMANGEAAAGAAEEVHAALSTGGVAGGHRTVIVTDDMESPADVDTTFRVQGDATLTIQDSAVFGTRVTVLNETDGPLNVVLTLSTGSSVKTVPAGQSWLFVWTGYWNDGLGSSPEVTAGDLRPVTSNAVAQYKSDSVASGDMRPVTSNAVASQYKLYSVILPDNTASGAPIPASSSTTVRDVSSLTVPAGLYVVTLEARFNDAAGASTSASFWPLLDGFQYVAPRDRRDDVRLRYINPSLSIVRKYSATHVIKYQEFWEGGSCPAHGYIGRLQAMRIGG